MGVADTGRGISSSYLKEVFREFEQEPIADLKDANVDLVLPMGLGLTIVKELAKLLGGKVYVESEQDIGTIITVEFDLKTIVPHKKSETVDIQGIAPKESQLLGKQDFCVSKLVVTVDDNEDNLLATKMLLEAFGLKVIATKNFGDFKEAFKENLDKVDLVFTDYRLRSDENNYTGEDVLDFVKSFNVDTPVVLYTASVHEELELERDKFAELLLKPATMQDFLRTLEKTIKNNDKSAKPTK